MVTIFSGFAEFFTFSTHAPLTVIAGYASSSLIHYVLMCERV